jgi:hypothetical protein
MIIMGGKCFETCLKADSSYKGTTGKTGLNTEVGLVRCGILKQSKNLHGFGDFGCPTTFGERYPQVQSFLCWRQALTSINPECYAPGPRQPSLSISSNSNSLSTRNSLPPPICPRSNQSYNPVNPTKTFDMLAFLCAVRSVIRQYYLPARIESTKDMTPATYPGSPPKASQVMVSVK